jgi:hypothetical protein
VIVAIFQYREPADVVFGGTWQCQLNGTVIARLPYGLAQAIYPSSQDEQYM